MIEMQCVCNGHITACSLSKTRVEEHGPLRSEGGVEDDSAEVGGSLDGCHLRGLASKALVSADD